MRVAITLLILLLGLPTLLPAVIEGGSAMTIDMVRWQASTTVFRSERDSATGHYRLISEDLTTPTIDLALSNRVLRTHRGLEFPAGGSSYFVSEPLSARNSTGRRLNRVRATVVVQMESSTTPTPCVSLRTSTTGRYWTPWQPITRSNHSRRGWVVSGDAWSSAETAEYQAAWRSWSRYWTGANYPEFLAILKSQYPCVLEEMVPDIRFLQFRLESPMGEPSSVSSIYLGSHWVVSGLRQ